MQRDALEVHPKRQRTAEGHSVAPLDWSQHSPVQPVELQVRVPCRQWHWFKTWTLKHVREMRPHDTKWTTEDQLQLLKSLHAVLTLPSRDDGKHVVVKVTCRPPYKGFPGRLYSPLANLCGPLRANMLIETADLDMSMAMHRVLLWICKQFGIKHDQLAYYVANRDGKGGMIERLMEETGCSKAKAKQHYTSPYTSGKSMHVRNSPFHAKLDAEAKEIQKALLERPELDWIKPHCRSDGGGGLAGSFVSHLYHFVECALLLAVSKVISAEFKAPVAALVFDGFNLANASLHGNQQVLDRAHAVCEQVCPGINMVWAWKPLDFTVKSADKLEPIQNDDGSTREVRVPADFVPPRQRGGKRPVGSRRW